MIKHKMKSMILVVCLVLGLSSWGFVSNTHVAHADALQIVQKVTGNIFYSTDEKSFKINTSGDGIHWIYYDYWGNEVESGQLAISGGTADLVVEPARNGWFRLIVTAKQGDNVLTIKETSFAVVAPFDASTIENSPFSVQTHAARTDIIAQSADALVPVSAKLGVKYLRDSFRWEDVERIPNELEFQVFHDNYLDLLGTYGIKPFMTLALYNALYDNGMSPTSEEARLAFANYAKGLLGNYPEVNWVEVWNEPDIPSFSKGLNTDEERAEFYFNLLKTTYEELKPLFPNVTISGMDVAEFGSGHFLEDLYQRGALQYMDEYSFHSYVRIPEEIIGEIENHKNLMKQYNNNQLIPMNLSETGFTNFNFDEYVQANYTARRVATALTQGIKSINIYNLQNRSTLPNDFEGTFGMVRHPDDAKGAYVPKPSFVAYATIIRQLSDAQFVQIEDVAPGLVYVYKFNNGTDDIYVMYAPSGTEVELHTTEAVQLTDMMGNSTQLQPDNGVVSLSLTQDPVYVKGSLTEINDIVPEITGPVSLLYSFYDGGYAETEGTLGTATNKWVTSSVLKGYDGRGSRAITHPTGASVRWLPAISVPGPYRISVYLPGNPAAPAYTTQQALYSIYVNDVKIDEIEVNQFHAQGKWLELGVYDMPRGANSYVLLEDSSALHDRPLRADALKLDLIPATDFDLELDSLTIQAGDAYTFMPIFTPVEATNRTVVWTSSNHEVASIDSAGNLQALHPGETTIRAFHPATHKFADVLVRVVDHPVIVPITIDSHYNTSGYTEQNGSLGTATNKWVNSTVLKGYHGGISRAITHPTDASAKWTPMLPQEGGYRISVYLPGNPETPAYTTTAARYSIYVDDELIDQMVINQFLLQGSWQELGTYRLPAGSHSYVVLEDANPAHNRPLRADAARFELTPITDVSLEPQQLTLTIGQSAGLLATFTPTDATDSGFIWSSSDPAIVTVDGTGEVTALKAGEAIVRATNPLTGIYAEATVTVEAVEPI
ncbi:Ig-like domain-containing protein [Paenibacillus sp. GCM10012307]|uniref:Ig-like domain-containing protein n=1 Tax=Paenibacillus roseus TaxID=2798579 RepID=A0A934J3B6_9BACL|nr:Ig-like domain-containing protein [Paenibacillus roseus]MBJ6362025.1 Ig-like domain-containing protein [Paenibacillus roseus]